MQKGCADLPQKHRFFLTVRMIVNRFAPSDRPIFTRFLPNVSLMQIVPPPETTTVEGSWF
ncbi:hypothetical protein THTE_0452 [Thermogutta terrifontis]|uniref:Uncharacterized protein n=1 Tax=Thermogutta terrifontis TaxID=1331910 RepID=A0A286RAQ9_9BACT|nr:hypothetical protein THTE_0452 [Thermogutta terrifontis]